MFKLIKLAVLFVMFLGFVAFGLLVKLGDKTLFGHLAAIGKSRESQDLVRGTKEVAKPIVERVQHVAEVLAADAGAADGRAAARDGGADAVSRLLHPADKLTDEDRAKLRGLLSGGKRR